MQLLLHVDSKSDIDTVLAAVYAFMPNYQFKHVGSGILETAVNVVLDTPATEKDFDATQWGVITGDAATVQLVPPTMP